MTGIVNLLKPSGLTSFSAAASVRRALGVKKCGHGGTLDPEATGVLPVLIGKATRLSDYFLTFHKTYEAMLRFGVLTDTGDVWGNVIDRHTDAQRAILGELTADGFSRALSGFTGAVSQIPPAYSALKIGGVPAYKLARKGESPELHARTVNIYSIDTVSFDRNAGEAVIRVECGRGTYIRTLCEDIAASLGLFGTMASLVRISYGPLDISQSVEVAAFTDGSFREKDQLLPCDAILKDLPEVRLGGTGLHAYQNGSPLSVDAIPDISETPGCGPYDVRVYGPDGMITGIGSVSSGILKGKINLAE